MKINLKQKIVTIRGEVVKVDNEEITVGFVLSTAILQPHKDKKGFRPLRAWELAKKLDSLEEIELDASELAQIKDILEDNENFYPFVIAQVQEVLINLEK